MPKPYSDICSDEVRYWFDVLQDNSIDNISDVTSIHRNKVQQLLSEQFNGENLKSAEKKIIEMVI